MERSHSCGSSCVDVCASAAARGDLGALERAATLGCPHVRRPWVFYGAVRGERFEVLRWLRALDPPCQWDSRACAAAAEKGNLEILRWLRASDPPCPWDQWVCRLAAMSGYLGVLQWLVAAGCPWDPHECRGLADLYGKADIVAWIDYCVAPEDLKEPEAG